MNENVTMLGNFTNSQTSISSDVHASKHRSLGQMNGPEFTSRCSSYDCDLRQGTSFGIASFWASYIGIEYARE